MQLISTYTASLLFLRVCKNEVHDNGFIEYVCEGFAACKIYN